MMVGVIGFDIQAYIYYPSCSFLVFLLFLDHFPLCISFYIFAINLFVSLIAKI